MMPFWHSRGRVGWLETRKEPPSSCERVPVLLLTYATGKGGSSQGADALRSACFFCRPSLFEKWGAPTLFLARLGDITSENE